MREVDDALSHAYARQGRDAERAASDAGSPPAPHLPARRTSAGRPSRVFLPPEAGPTPATVGGVALEWPEVVSVLEKSWGDRFRQMADRILEARERKGVRVLLFTSCHRAEGRTTLVLTLARTLARRPLKTLVVDADLSGPMLARSLGLQPEVGLDDVVEDGKAIEDALIEAPGDHLWVLPMRAAVARPRDFLASAAWACAMAKLRRDFDLVLIDGSPLFTGLSAAVMHRSVDAAVLVHNRDATGQRSILRAREVLEAGGVPLLGLAETFA
ncbi:CpsD/CapB family tyrosine-protein kinase [Paludisphaera mucosa]|uniref:CpsD/CapB family tyrosine-protein kinase n=1 Tax=Paludisphaera mucosa TaxID=3030827 RepID=A0ABT6FDG7_9BACT|nr:CpsD/CapB family tyrosine-protein kinase [Paludisphaera mucosa]MDG3005628.1 CpsD/CapB family tyrosine-protein kinase [Paludisphaera mucosa]